MNGKPSNRKKKTTTVATMDGVTLTAAQAGAIFYPYLMSFGYCVIAELIEVFVQGGMPEDKAKENAAAIALRAMARFKAGQERELNGQSAG